jgi:hypothetical protein
MAWWDVFVDFSTLIKKVDAMSKELDDLTTAVAAEHDAVTSMVTLLDGLAAKIDTLVAAGSDPAALTALADAIRADTDKITAAVTTDAR